MTKLSFLYLNCVLPLCKILLGDGGNFGCHIIPIRYKIAHIQQAMNTFSTTKVHLDVHLARAKFNYFLHNTTSPLLKSDCYKRSLYGDSSHAGFSCSHFKQKKIANRDVVRQLGGRGDREYKVCLCIFFSTLNESRDAVLPSSAGIASL